MRFTKEDKEYLTSLGESEMKIAQIEIVSQARYTKYDLDGKPISRAEAIRLLGRQSYLAGLSRSAFHRTAVQTVTENEDDGVISFDSSKFFEED